MTKDLEIADDDIKTAWGSFAPRILRLLNDADNAIYLLEEAQMLIRVLQAETGTNQISEEGSSALAAAREELTVMHTSEFHPHKVKTTEEMIDIFHSDYSKLIPELRRDIHELTSAWTRRENMAELKSLLGVEGQGRGKRPKWRDAIYQADIARQVAELIVLENMDEVSARGEVAERTEHDIRTVERAFKTHKKYYLKYQLTCPWLELSDSERAALEDRVRQIIAR
ncbi:MAG: hypothetical protein K0U72_09760 [Gammaproteobacteria bacterium]|nr:hypothetical protein [Gammaproteobacteria bacterium]